MPVDLSNTMHATDTDADRISATVVEAIADAADIDPHELDPPLYRAVDGDALDALLEGGDPVRITFRYRGFTVDVRSDGTVDVDATVPDRSARTPQQ